MIKEKTWTESIVIRSVDYGESDLILGLFTKDLGNISIFLRGAKNSKRRYAGLDLFSGFRALIVPPKLRTGSFFQLESFENIDINLEIRGDLSKFCQVSYMAECTWLFLGELDAQPEFFVWWKSTLERMKRRDFQALDQVQLDLEMLRWFGYFPSFETCYECGRKIENENVFFAFSQGSIVCRGCHKASVGRWLHSDSFTGQHNSSLRESLDAFVKYTLGKQPRSQKIREELSGGYSGKVS